MRTTGATFGLLCLMLAGATHALAQANTPRRSPILSDSQVVALDECDPTTFNQALGPDFCKNISLGYFTTLSDLFSKHNPGILIRTGISNLTRSTSRKGPLLA